MTSEALADSSSRATECLNVTATAAGVRTNTLMNGQTNKHNGSTDRNTCCRR